MTFVNCAFLVALLGSSAANAAIVFNDDFNGSVLDVSKWTEYRFGADVVTVASGTAHFASKTVANTCGKYTFNGTGGIVVEARMAGPGGLRDTHIELVDAATGDWIQAGDTNYQSQGFTATAQGSSHFRKAAAVEVQAQSWNTG